MQLAGLQSQAQDAQLETTTSSFTKDDDEVMLSGLQARLRYVERNLAAMIDERNDEGERLRKEIADVLNSERHALRDSLVAELREAMTAAEQRFERQMSQAVGQAVGQFVGQQQDGAPAVERRVTAVEQRVERQLAADSATLTGLVARCQDLARDFQSERAERHASFTELRADLEQRQEKLAVGLHKAIMASEAASAVGTAAASKEGGGMGNGDTTRFEAQLMAMQGLASRQEAMTKELREDVKAHCASTTSCFRSQADEISSRVDELRHSLQSIEAKLSQELATALARVSSLATKFDDVESKLGAPGQQKLSEGAGDAVSAEMLQRLRAELRSELAPLDSLTAQCQDIYGKLREEREARLASNAELSVQCNATAALGERTLDMFAAELRKELGTELSKLRAAGDSSGEGQALAKRLSDMAEAHVVLQESMQEVISQSEARGQEALREVEGRLGKALESLSATCQQLAGLQAEAEACNTDLVKQIKEVEELAERRIQAHSEAMSAQDTEHRQRLAQYLREASQAVEMPLAAALDATAAQCKEFSCELQAERDLRVAKVQELREELMKELHRVEGRAEQRHMAVYQMVLQEMVSVKDAEQQQRAAASSLPTPLVATSAAPLPAAKTPPVPPRPALTSAEVGGLLRSGSELTSTGPGDAGAGSAAAIAAAAASDGCAISTASTVATGTTMSVTEPRGKPPSSSVSGDEVEVPAGGGPDKDILAISLQQTVQAMRSRLQAQLQSDLLAVDRGESSTLGGNTVAISGSSSVPTAKRRQLIGGSAW